MPVVVKLVQFALMNSPYPQLSLDRRDERRPLEQGSSKSLEGSRELGFASRQLVVEPYDTDILFPRSLLRLYKSCRTVYTHYETASDFGVECSAVSCFLHPAAASAAVEALEPEFSTSKSSSPRQQPRGWKGWKACRD